MRPLQGIRITDFTWAAAGPTGTQYLTYLGAEAIKLESRRRIEHRKTTAINTSMVGDDSLNKGAIFNNVNLGKLSISLDLGHPQGQDIVRRLVAVSDVVVENFRPGVMTKLGCSYEALRRLNPTLVMLSASNSGQTGPEAFYMGYAPIFAALGGIGHMTGFPDGPPAEYRIAGDIRVGLTIAFAVLAALWHRRMTGCGQYIDLSAREVHTMYVPEAVMEYTMNRVSPLRNGNRDAIMAPHGVYPCRGEDRWVSIAVGTDDEFRLLCQAAGHPEWASDGRFADPYLRWHNQDALDQLIAEWTRNLSPHEVMDILQRAGVAAAPSMSIADIVADGHLRARGALAEVEHPETGTTLKPTPPWHFSATPTPAARHAPLFAEHNEYVYRELLGLGPAEVSALAAGGVFY